MRVSLRFHQIAATLGLFLLVAIYPARATAQEVMYSDTWNDDIEDNLDLPLHGVGVTEEASGYSPEQVETTMYGDDRQVVHSTQSSVDYYYVETFVFGRVAWDITTDAPVYCAETLHWRYLLDWGMELIGETASQRPFERVQSRWKYNRQLPAGDYEYLKSGNNGCRNRCVTDRQCFSVRGAWLGANGWVLGGTVCAAKKYATDTEPPCKGLWGDPIGTTGCSS